MSTPSTPQPNWPRLPDVQKRDCERLYEKAKEPITRRGLVQTKPRNRGGKHASQARLLAAMRRGLIIPSLIKNVATVNPHIV